MKTFALKDGDLVLTGDRLAMVTGAARLQQQVSLALQDVYAADRFHPTWGSALENMIGTAITSNLTQEVRVEVLRVLRNYIALQRNMMSDRSSKALKPTFTQSEIIADVSSISVDQQQDSVTVKVALRAADGQEIVVLTSNGSL